MTILLYNPSRRNDWAVGAYFTGPFGMWPDYGPGRPATALGLGHFAMWPWQEPLSEYVYIHMLRAREKRTQRRKGTHILQ